VSAAGGDAPDRADPDDPLGQDEIETLQAELRQALQHQRAALEHMAETQAELRRLMDRARGLLDAERVDPEAESAPE
jgi:hypothetical protein